MKTDDILLVVALVLMVIGFAFIFGIAEPPQALSPPALARTINGVFDSVETFAANIQTTARMVWNESARGLRELQYAPNNMGEVQDTLRDAQSTK
jgi:hypothetical protein